MRRPSTVSYVRRKCSDEAFVAIMFQMAMRARKSRKAKEYLRAVIRTWKADVDERDFIYFCGKFAAQILFMGDLRRIARLAAARASAIARLQAPVTFPSGGISSIPGSVLRASQWQLLPDRKTPITINPQHND